MTHRIRIEDLGFSAAHFATFGGECEPLHGHNYRVVVEIAGDVDADSWVMDFRRVKTLIAEICGELDHRFVLQGRSRHLRIEESEVGYVVCFGSRRYVIPREDVISLPIENTTAERLAEWLAGQVVAAIRQGGANNLMSVTIGVEEAPGQSGWFTRDMVDGRG